MTCALCHADAPRLNSHVIPEFLYKSLYDEKHRFHQISVLPNQKNLYRQKGLREPLLCEECEQKLSLWEGYTSRLLAGTSGASATKSGKWIHLSGVDYSLLKLFQLSVLWRAAVSALPIFSQIALGPHEERIRQMLVKSDPGRAETYGCLMFALMNDETLLCDLIVQPTWSRLDQHKAYRFVFGGLMFVYVVSNSPVASFIAEHFVQQAGTATVQLKQANKLPFIAETAVQMRRLGKLEI